MFFQAATESTGTKATNLGGDSDVVTSRSVGTRLESGDFKKPGVAGAAGKDKKSCGLALQEL